ncbi:FtsX-like permease family protein [Arachidicoccus rhizosphaerae]|uniref:FtsX-like permease family protein n=1 Tax=Arachidicoccus rhizosphaerae TaxID=551991 RepID=A0A1H3YV14_9BACT|nr:ABC transporter permease [Arachidicoccus rhizosphaerae]SEA15326.1 FtsX-like permease family protein [Arachidicoccus rhizosphaerae]
MFHSLKIATRSAFGRKADTIINMLGLVLGITFSLFIFLWIRNERQTDHNTVDNNRVYIIYESSYVGGQRNGEYSTPGILGAALKKEIPEIQYAANVSWLKDTPDKVLYKAGDKSLIYDTYYADSDYFKMMNYPFIMGNKANALASPQSLCISETMAKGMFGSAETAFGKSIQTEDGKELQVTGIFKDLPSSASAKYDCMVNWSVFLEESPYTQVWSNTGPNTLIMLKENADPQQVAKKLDHFLYKYTEHSEQHHTELGMQLFKNSYLQDQFDNGQLAGGRIELVRLFSIIAIFIIAIACVNFINLSTAQATKRAKEVGVRKVAGASRLHLIMQFMAESMLLVFISLIMALLVVNCLLPSFNTFVGKQILFPFGDIQFWLKVLTLALVIGIAAGLYPAILISSFKPALVLKGNMGVPKANIFRKGLVVFQFTIAIALIVATVIVDQQLDYMQETALGYNKKDLLDIHLQGNMAKKYTYFKQKARAIPGVRSLSTIQESPTNIGSWTTAVLWPGKDVNQITSFTQSYVGYDFIQTMGLHLIAGRDYIPGRAADTTGFIINESAQHAMGLKDPIGQLITSGRQKGEIIGVIKDFHFASLHDAIKPLILHWSNLDYGHTLIRIEAGMTTKVMADLKQLHKEVNPGLPFNYAFIQDDYNKLYQNENTLSKISGCFSFLAIFISGLGLLGLILHSVSRRKKEIGIRKVLGARVSAILILLSKEFIYQVLIAFIIATPVSWYLMNRWLSQYAYKIDISWRAFLAAGVGAMLIALLTVGLQALKTARANPVESIKSE